MEEPVRTLISPVFLVVMLVSLFLGRLPSVMATVPGTNVWNLPGAEPFPSELLSRLEAKRQQLPTTYEPRTRHKHPDGRAVFTNRLLLETSPYLLQHAHNPVNWYPWGDEAFETARRLNRPILLSVGYSTCHWCHVMEEESFEDSEIAAYLNAHFVAIKVDREERPDIDAIYMQAVLAQTGSGGWPMTVMLTADGRPFFGGTYFPPRDGDRGMRLGFLSLLKETKTVFEKDPEQIAQVSQQLSQFVKRQMSPIPGDALPDETVLHKAMDTLKKGYDAQFGGLQRQQKFPSSLPIRVLLRYHRRSGDEQALGMARATLNQMAAGGIYDHVGGGFHRYATDPRWQIPHFEKMLYDNAQLAQVYLEGFQVTRDPAYEAMVHHLLTYIDREMTAPQGGFYSATDADSLTPSGKREEGYFFTWTRAEVDKILGEKQGALFADYYGLTDRGNFEGRNILFRVPDRTSPPAGLDLERAHRLLYEGRKGRPAPLKDDKILTAWNGLMISALAQSGMVLNRPEYIARAEKAARFILKEMMDRQGLYRSYRNGEAKQAAFLEDYAFLTAALLDLYDATNDPQWLARAINLDVRLSQGFEDKEKGGFFRTDARQKDLLAREKPFIDGAIPSGNAIALMNLLRLGDLTFDDSYRQRAEKSFKTFAANLQRYPFAFPHLLIALDFYLDQPKEIVLVTPKGKIEQAAPFLEALDRTYLPNRFVTLAEEGKGLKAHQQLVPVARGKIALGGQTTAYVCTKGICELPTTLPEQFEEQIRVIHPLAPAGKGEAR